MKSAVILLALALPVWAKEDFATLLKRGDALDAQLKTKEALAVYLEAEKLQPDHVRLLCQIAKQYGESQAESKDKTWRRETGQKALDYAKRAVALDPQNALAQLSLAISYGRLAPYLDNKTKIAYSKLVKEHVDRSLALNPSDDLAWHVLGAWHYELANLNAVLRAVAQLIYGKLPAASNEEAVKAFQKACELNPRRVGNWVELGRALAALGKNAEAKTALERGLALPNRMRDDPETKERARAALQRL
jgi:tetratricopeptide (TPR) repeat protein